jgi:hypothetical protein
MIILRLFTLSGEILNEGGNVRFTIAAAFWNFSEHGD